MSMTPERVAERVAGMIESIRKGGSRSFSQHNSEETLRYIDQVQTLGIIDQAQHAALVKAVEKAVQEWQPEPDSGHLFSDEFR